jgi:hypothetical protein
VQIAWKLIQKDPELNEFFLRVTAKAGKKKAIVAVARKLLMRMKVCLRGWNHEQKERPRKIGSIAFCIVFA